MAQKVALARALINLPNLLLLDEPFISLDQITKMKLQEEVAMVLNKEKTTVLMVTHDIEEAIFLSDKVIVLSNRPAEIKKEFNISFNRPRKESIKYTKEFIEVKKNISSLLL